MGKLKVIIDTDPGVDDAMAILMVLRRHEEIEVLAITACNGNTNVNQASKNAVRILNTVDRLDIPVFVGASTPLAGPSPVKDKDFHGKDGLGDSPDSEILNYDKYLSGKEDAIHALLRIVNGNPGEVVLLCLGPLTNIASALKVDPSFGSKLKSCIIMGGNYMGQGNVTPFAEFNFYEDPDAADFVLTHMGITICLIALELCVNIILGWEWYDEITGKATKVSRFLKKIGSEMKKNAISSNLQTFAWDQYAAAVLIEEKVIKSFEHVSCRVELSGLKRGEMLVDWNKSKKWEGIHVKLVKEMDVDLFKGMLEDTVSW